MPTTIPSEEAYERLHETWEKSLDTARLAALIHHLFTGRPSFPRLLNHLQTLLQQRNVADVFSTLHDTARQSGEEGLNNLLADKSRLRLIRSSIQTILNQAPDTDEGLQEAFSLLATVPETLTLSQSLPEDLLETKPTEVSQAVSEVPVSADTTHNTQTTHHTSTEHKASEQEPEPFPSVYPKSYPKPPLYRDDILSLLNVQREPQVQWNAAALSRALFHFAQTTAHEEAGLALETTLQWLVYPDTAPQSESARWLLENGREQFPELLSGERLTKKRWEDFIAWQTWRRRTLSAAIRTALLAEDNTIITPYHWHFLLKKKGSEADIFRNPPQGIPTEPAAQWIAKRRQWQYTFIEVLADTARQAPEAALWELPSLADGELYHLWLEEYRTPLEAYAAYFALEGRFLEQIWATLKAAESHIAPARKVTPIVDHDIEQLRHDLNQCRQYPHERTAFARNPNPHEATRAAAEAKPTGPLLPFEAAILREALEREKNRKNSRLDSPERSPLLRRMSALPENHPAAEQWREIVHPDFLKALFQAMKTKAGVPSQVSLPDNLMLAVETILAYQKHTLEPELWQQVAQELTPYTGEAWRTALFSRMHTLLDQWYQDHLAEHLQDWICPENNNPDIPSVTLRNYATYLRLARALNAYNREELTEQKTLSQSLLSTWRQAFTWLWRWQQLRTWYGSPVSLPQDAGELLLVWLHGTRTLHAMVQQLEIFVARFVSSDGPQRGTPSHLFCVMLNQWKTHQTTWHTSWADWVSRAEEPLRTAWQYVMQAFNPSPQTAISMTYDLRQDSLQRFSPAAVLNWLLTTLTAGTPDPDTAKRLFTVYWLWWTQVYIQTNLQGGVSLDAELPETLDWIGRIAEAAVPWQRLLQEAHVADTPRYRPRFTYRDCQRVARAFEALSEDEKANLMKTWRTALLGMAADADCDVEPAIYHELCLLAAWVIALPAHEQALHHKAQAAGLSLEQKTRFLVLARDMASSQPMLLSWVQQYPKTAYSPEDIPRYHAPITIPYWFRYLDRCEHLLMGHHREAARDSLPALLKLSDGFRTLLFASLPPEQHDTFRRLWNCFWPYQEAQALPKLPPLAVPTAEPQGVRPPDIRLRTQFFETWMGYFRSVYDSQSILTHLWRKLKHQDAGHRMVGMMQLLSSIENLGLAKSTVEEVPTNEQCGEVIRGVLGQQPDGITKARKGDMFQQTAENMDDTLANRNPRHVTLLTRLRDENARLREEKNQEKGQREENENQWKKDKKRWEEDEKKHEATKQAFEAYKAAHPEEKADDEAKDAPSEAKASSPGPSSSSSVNPEADLMRSTRRFHFYSSSTSADTEPVTEGTQFHRPLYPQPGSE